MFIEKVIKNKKNKTYMTIKELKSSKKKVLIYGAGVYAYVLKKYLNAMGIKIFKFVVDKKFIKKKTFIKEKAITLESILKKFNNYNIVFGQSNIKNLKKNYKKFIHLIDIPDFLNIQKIL